MCFRMDVKALYLINERNSSATDVRHARKISDRADQSQKAACSIRTGLAVIGQKLRWVDQRSSRGVGQGTRDHKPAGS